MRFEIGQTVWTAHWDASENYVTCPDCGGTGRLRVTFHDETQVSIDCQNCGPGYNPPTGRIKVYDRKPRAQCTVITGVDICGKETRWRILDSYIVDDDKVFTDEASALAKANEIAAEADAAERKKVFQKEKDGRTWSWNAVYHRRCIKEAQRQIEYHSAKLAVAAIKAKETKAD
jgi:ribosomal protein S27E